MSLKTIFFPPSRPVEVRSPLDPAAAEARLRAAIVPARMWQLPAVGAITGQVRAGRIRAWVAAGRNSWRPILSGRIEADAGGGSVVRGRIGPATWVNVFSLVWLIGALALSGTLLVAAIVGLVTGTPTIRSGQGAALAGPSAILLSLAVLLFFGGMGVALPWVARRMSTGDPDRLIAFLEEAVQGKAVPA
jgi:hypothetical protein